MRRGFLVLAAAALVLTGCHEYWGRDAGASDYTATGSLTYDPTVADEKARSNVRAAIPAIEAWKADHGTYEGMTVAALNSEYDGTIGDSVRLVGALTRDTYCVESTVNGDTWSYRGPRRGFRHGGC